MKIFPVILLLIILPISYVFSNTDVDQVEAVPDNHSLNIYDDLFFKGYDCWEEYDYTCARYSMQALQDLNYDPTTYNGIPEYILGDIYSWGYGVEVDIKLGIYWLEEAYKLSDHDQIKSLVATDLAWNYYTDIAVRDYNLAKEWAEKSILFENYHDYALNNYGVFLEEGILFEKNDELAFEYYKRASEIEDPAYYSLSNLGRFYALGLGNVRKSKEKSIDYFNKAITQGGAAATTSITYLNIINRYNRLPNGIQEAAMWLEEEIYKYGGSNFLILGWLHDDYDKVEGLKWFILQEKLGENISDRNRARELIDRTHELLNNDEKLINKAEKMANEWKDEYWDNSGEGKKNFLDNVEWGNYYALLIGNSKYRNDYLADLQTPKSDVQEIESILKKKYDFKTKLLLDATSDEIYNTIYSYRDLLEEKDSLLIYYAGHGSLDTANGVGYWQAVDAQENKPWTWISNQSVTDVIKSMRANHIIVIADSCYSGTFVYRGGEEIDTPKDDKNLTIFYKKKKSKKARLALTSGDYQPVPDSLGGHHSPFAKSLILTLDQNEQVLLSSKLHVMLEKQLALESIYQEPLYGAIMNSNHREGADFIFMPSNVNK